MPLDLGALQSGNIDLGALQTGSFTLPGIPTEEAFGVLEFGQLITIAGIPTEEAFGTIVIIRGPVIALAGIPTEEAFGALSVHQAQGIILPGINDGDKIGVPTIVGGLLKLRIYIGGIDRTANFKISTASIQSQTMGRWSANFDIQVNDGVWAPSLGQTILIQDFGRNLFAGCLHEITVDRAMSTDSVITFQCLGLDKASICDHRQVTEAFYPAGTDAADIFRDLAAKFLTGEGLTTAVLPASIDTIDTDLPLNYCSVTSAYDQVATLVEASWWVDIFGQLNLRRTAAADDTPFAFTETSKNWRNATVKYSLVDFKTSVYVRSNLSALPGSAAAAGVTESWVVQQAAAAALGLAQGAGILSVPAASVLQLTVNGVAKSFYYAGDPVTYDVTNPLYGHVWWMFPNTDTVIPPGSASSVPSPAEKPALGDVIAVQYIPSVAQSTAVVKAGTPFVPTAMPGITPAAGESYKTCGSGIFEWTEQVNDIVKIADLQAIGAAILARSPTPPIVLRIETDVPGAAVGQRLHVTLPKIYIPDTHLFITSVQARAEATDLLVNHPELKWDGRGSSFRYQIEATSVQDVSVWMKWFERLVRRTEHPNPVIRVELATFIIAPGGSVVSGTVDANPHRVKRNNKLIECYAVAGIPPVDQDLYLDIVSATLGKSILLAPLKIPATSTALVSTVAFYANPAFLFKNDVLRCTAAYVVTGANPVPAGSVSLDLVGEY